MTVGLAPLTCTIFCVDHDSLVCQAVRQLAESTDGLAFIGSASDPAHAIDSMITLRPSIAVLDLMFPHDTGLALLGSMRLHVPETKPIVFCSLPDPSIARKCLQLGACGFVSKYAAMEALADAITRVARGELAFSQDIADKLLRGYLHTFENSQNSLDCLSAIELAVFLMVGQSMSTEDISKRLFKSTKTIEAYKRRARQKLGFNSAAEMATYATKYVLCPPV